MVIETFVEAARLLYPHLAVRAIREAEFLEILECPPDIGRHSEIFCRRISSSAGEIVCEVSLFSSEISPRGRLIDRTCLNYKAQVILGCETEFSSMDPSAFPVKKEELDGGPINHKTILRSYRNSLHKGRYRVLGAMDGTGPDSVRARFVYRESEDFAPPLQTCYQYSPYLLEAILHMCGNFYVEIRRRHEERQKIGEGKAINDHKSVEPKEQKSSRRSRPVRKRTIRETGSPISRDERPLTDFGRIIPHKIGEIGFARKCVRGESIVLEGRITARNDEGFVWTARGVDNNGQTLMWVRDLVMRWVSR